MTGVQTCALPISDITIITSGKAANLNKRTDVLGANEDMIKRFAEIDRKSVV